MNEEAFPPCTASAIAMADAAAEEAEQQLLRYPLLTSVVDGHPVYAYIPVRLKLHRRRPRRAASPACGLLTVFLFLAAAISFFAWPRSIDMTVAGLTLNSIHFNVKKGDSFVPQVFLDLSLDVRLEARNPNFFGVTYDNVTVSILFEDDEIGHVESYGARLDALTTSQVNATLDLHGYRIAGNVLRLLADIANKALPLQTITRCRGLINLYLINIPLEGKITCNLVVNPQEQLILSEDCV